MRTSPVSRNHYTREVEEAGRLLSLIVHSHTLAGIYAEYTGHDPK